MTSTPVIVGVGQLTQRWQSAEAQLDPVELMAEAARRAIADAGGRGVAAAIDALWVVNVALWSYRDAPGDVARALGIEPGHREYTAIGGNTPQLLVNRAATALESGKHRAVLLVGAEAGASARQAAKLGVELTWPPSETPASVVGERRSGCSGEELAHDLALPINMYPLIESVLRARSGRSPDEHAGFLGRMLAPMSRVASDNPLAWDRTAYSVEAIAAASPDNRYVGYPYTKRMNPVIHVDQGAAVLLTTEREASRLGIDRERCVYPMGGVELNDVWFPTERPDLDRSPAIAIAARRALEQAGLGLGDIDWFDLYSCFPSAVQIACREIGLALDDPRGLTVTGGLPYFGGPGSNYSMHAIATVTDKIRELSGHHALVTALGWYTTKHAIGIYGSEPPALRWCDRPDTAPAQAEIDGTALPTPLTAYDGQLRVEAFVISHGRDGCPQSGVVLGRNDEGARVLAFIAGDADELGALESEEMVGRRGVCRNDRETGRNLMRIA